MIEWKFKDKIKVEYQYCKVGWFEYKKLVVSDKKTNVVIFTLDNRSEDQYFPSESIIEEGGYCILEWVESNYDEELEEFYKKQN